jgi:hypothetical protein
MEFIAHPPAKEGSFANLRKRLFFEKKKQKTFDFLKGLLKQASPNQRAMVPTGLSKTQKFFASFFQKTSASLNGLPWPSSAANSLTHRLLKAIESEPSCKT